MRHRTLSDLAAFAAIALVSLPIGCATAAEPQSATASRPAPATLPATAFLNLPQAVIEQSVETASALTNRKLAEMAADPEKSDWTDVGAALRWRAAKTGAFEQGLGPMLTWLKEHPNSHVAGVLPAWGEARGRGNEGLLDKGKIAGFIRQIDDLAAKGAPEMIPSLMALLLGNHPTWNGGSGQFIEIERERFLIWRRGVARMQNADGGWGRAKGQESSVTRTAAALAIVGCCEREIPWTDPLRQTDPEGVMRRGFEWLDKNFDKFLDGKLRDGLPPAESWLLLQDSAILTGRFQIAGRHISDCGTRELLRLRRDDGTWPDPWAETPRAAMFLDRTRNPAFGHLKYDGRWDIRQAGVAQVARFIGRAWCAVPLRYHVVDVDADISQWPAAPVLITCDKWPRFTPTQLMRLRQYILLGGTVWIVPQGTDGDLSAAVRELTQDFGQITMTDAERVHKSSAVPPPPRLPAKVATNGMRPLVIICESDLTRRWQLGYRDSQETANELFTYAAGGLLPAIPLPPNATTRPVRAVTMARIRHGGNWDPEPLAYERFARRFTSETGVALGIVNVSPAELAKSKAKVAVLVSTNDVGLTKEDRAALEAFVSGGGLLICDAPAATRPSRRFAPCWRRCTGPTG